MPLRRMVGGRSGAVYSFVRPNNREPAKDFLENLQKDVSNKFRGSFDFFTKMGAEYEIHSRFKPLHNEGKPLWEFKEHAHHFYAVREVFTLTDRTGQDRKIAVVVLLDGWKKEKGGKGKKEERDRIGGALNLYNEYRSAGMRKSDGTDEPLGTALERKERLRH
ncbi:hypothetical protein [Candidatus Binatus sp.]|uniref:hypothetical protein n=1 Tax=Candidatus Binatus sp. TaxID=2811406 RepID=UPI003C636C34